MRIAIGVTIAHSAPPGAFVSLVIVLYAAWTGQVIGNALFGGYVSGFVGAVVMTAAAYLLARIPSTMPVYAMFLPGFWLLNWLSNGTVAGRMPDSRNNGALGGMSVRSR